MFVFVRTRRGKLDIHRRIVVVRVHYYYYYIVLCLDSLRIAENVRPKCANRCSSRRHAVKSFFFRCHEHNIAVCRQAWGLCKYKHTNSKLIPIN